MGEISLRWKGVQFARRQLNCGLQTFSPINFGDFDLPFDDYCDDDDDQQVSDNEDSTYGGEDNSECDATTFFLLGRR